MTYLRTVPPEEATGLLREIYDAYLARFGEVPHIIRAVSLRPAALRLAHRFRVSVVEGGSLGTRRAEMVAVRVAHLLQCHYCAPGHSEFLRRAAVPDEEILALRDWQASALFDPLDRELLGFCDRFTLHPGTLGPADVRALEERGLGATGAGEALLRAGYRHYQARIGSGLGVELDRMVTPPAGLAAAYRYDPEAQVSPVRRAWEAAGRGIRRAGGGDGDAVAPLARVEEADLRGLGAAWRQATGGEPSLLWALGFRPVAARAAGEFMLGVAFGASDLGSRAEDLLGLEVARLASCPSFQALHGARLGLAAGTAPPEAAALAADSAEGELASFAGRLTLEPARTSERDIDRLRRVGLSDGQVLDAVILVAAWNCFCRLANASLQ